MEWNIYPTTSSLKVWPMRRKLQINHLRYFVATDAAMKVGKRFPIVYQPRCIAQDVDRTCVRDAVNHTGRFTAMTLSYLEVNYKVKS